MRKKSSISAVRLIAFVPDARDLKHLKDIEKEMMEEAGTKDPNDIPNSDIIRRAMYGSRK